MSKLKTLKDIDRMVRCAGIYVPDYIRSDDLRSVAREWIKYLNKPLEDTDGFFIGKEWIQMSSVIGGEYNPATNPSYAIELFIKHFFNLVEDE